MPINCFQKLNKPRTFYEEKVRDKPFVGLAPMDGVTDAAFRHIASKHSKPDLMFTEFVSVDGICAGAVKLLQDFIYTEKERPIIAQLFGSDSALFYKSAAVVCELGFDGVDINMGCPAKSVASRGGGAALIKNPKTAREIVRQTKKGVKDWAEGKNLEKFGLPEEIVSAVKAFKSVFLSKVNFHSEKLVIPVSVKTRIGYDEVIIEEWIKCLLETYPAAISIHGRTFRQRYTGKADWEAIGKAVLVAEKSNTSIIGNGDVSSLAEAREKAEKYGVDGVLIGRAAMGSPWIFTGRIPTKQERLQIAVEHSKYFEKINDSDYKKNIGTGKSFAHIRKHLSRYCRGFDGAKELRIKLMKAENADEVENIIEMQN